jgi:signal transduction histidine kinase
MSLVSSADGVSKPGLLSLAVGAIVLSLLLLVLVPLGVERQMDRIRIRVVEVADSAHLEANEIALSLAREMAVLRGFSVDADSTFLLEYQEWRLREDEANRRMDELLPRLPLAFRRRFEAASLRADRWHDAADSQLAAGPDGPMGTGPPDQLFARSEFQAVLREQAALQAGLDTLKADAIRRVQRAEIQGLIASILLASLALLSTALVVWLGRRVRMFAVQAHRNHLEVLQANDARVRLMRGFSHDIKNPLGVVLLSAELLDIGVHGPLTQEQREVVERISRAGAQVRELLDDLMDLSRAEMGLLQIESESVDLRALLVRVVEDNSDRLAAAELSIQFDRREESPIVRADPRRLRQILDNLIGNAIKYTPAGGTITLRYFEPAYGEQSGGEKLAVEVEDTGPGIPADQIEHVFEEFVRLPGAYRQGGSGIGLTISRHLARLMNGDITLRSEPGRGSTFTLWLPVSTEAPVHRPSEVPAGADPGHPGSVG